MISETHRPSPRYGVYPFATGSTRLQHRSPFCNSFHPSTPAQGQGWVGPFWRGACQHPLRTTGRKLVFLRTAAPLRWLPFCTIDVGGRVRGVGEAPPPAGFEPLEGARMRGSGSYATHTLGEVERW